MTENGYVWSCFSWKLSIQLPYLVFVCCAVILCLFLSHWQWQRAQAAQARYAQYQSQLSAPVTPLSISSQQYQKVAISGHVKQLFWLDNQIYKGEVGGHVLAAVQTEQVEVLVNLGWQAKNSPKVQLNQLPTLLTIEGRLKNPQSGFMLQAANEDPNWPQVIQQIQIPLLNDYFSYSLLPLVLYADESVEQLIPASLVIENKYPMHIGYAIQWLLIAGLCVIGFVVICRQEYKRNETS